MRRFIWLLALLLCAAEAHAADSVKAEAKVIKDGDTPLIEIRMYGIDTPEKKQKCENREGQCYACGTAATEKLKALTKNKDLRFEFTGDVTYGRPVATLYDGEKDINLEMVQSGWAVAYTRFLEGEMKRRYLAAQDEAKAAKRGIWQGKFIPPSKWRNNRERLDCE